MSQRTPYFKDMTTPELVSALKDWQQTAYNWGRMAQSVNPKSRDGRRVAAGWGRSERNVEIITALLERRGDDWRTLYRES